MFVYYKYVRPHTGTVFDVCATVAAWVQTEEGWFSTRTLVTYDFLTIMVIPLTTKTTLRKSFNNVHQLHQQAHADNKSNNEAVKQQGAQNSKKKYR